MNRQMCTVRSQPYRIYPLLLILLLLLSHPAHAAKRVALVIGNGSYASAPLKNPVNDAADMARLLKKLDFEVIKTINGDKREMLNAVKRFSSKLKKSEVGLFYFAGHGMQINNRNYLLPVGVNVAEESDVEFEAVDAGRIISKMKTAENKLNVVILDACRNNPFKRSFRSATQGLARMDAPKGTIIAYATSPGSVAADGRGRNGIFTKHLLDAMAAPNLDLQNVFNEAGIQVMKETGDRQVPWTSNTPIPRFYLAGGLSVPEERNQKPEAGKDAGSIKISSNPSGARVFIDGRVAGETPVELGDMVPGSKTIRVEKSGYATEEKQTTIRKGRRSVVRFDLQEEISKGWLTVSPNPSDAQIRILNINPLYKKDMALDPGRYHVEVSAEGYETKRQWVELAAGDALDVDISLQRERVQQSIVTPVSLSQSSGSGSNFTDPTTGMEFVHVPGGCYQMGDTFGDGDSDEQPVHEVCVDGFYMGKYEVTQGEYQKITGSNPSNFKKGNNYPVETVSWNEAQAFIEKLNSRTGKKFRLPTEAEWEYAARAGGKKVRFGTGKDTIGPDEANFDGSSKYKESYSRSGVYRKQTTAVGSFSPNSLGLYDMSGNVWEWCSDWYGKGYYSASPRNNPQGASSGSYRVARGGSWYAFPRIVRSAARSWAVPGDRRYGLGFRLVFPEGSK